MEKNVVSLDLAKKLPRDEFKDCQFWHVKYDEENEQGTKTTLEEVISAENLLLAKVFGWKIYWEYPAPLTDEILEKLPDRIVINETDFFIEITKIDENQKRVIRYVHVDAITGEIKIYGSFHELKLADCLGQMYLYLKDNNLI